MELSRKLSTAILPMTYLAKWKNAALRQTAVEPLASDEAERSLRIGDYVSLFSVEHNGYLSTDGFSDEVCHLKKVPQTHAALAPNNFENCVFEIVPRFKYDMQVNLDDMLSTYGRERESIGLYDDGDPQIEKQLKVLVQQEELERKENLAEYHRTANKNVAYGQIVQLRHVKSKCFLSLTVKEAAELEKDALRIVLEKEGSEGSWFIITPRLKMRSEGEPVNLGDQVAFISKKFNIFLHCSIKSSRSEINGSSAFTPWRIIPFAPFAPASNTSQFLKAGDVVRIFHKEIEGFLTDEYQLESYDDKKDPSGPHDRNSTSSASSGTSAASGSLATRGTDKLFFESPSTVTSTANDGGTRPGSGSSSHSHSTSSAQQHSATSQKTTMSISNSNSNSLWLVEMENTMRGGIVTFDKCVRFKHIPSGKYLASELPPTPPITSASTGHLGAAGGLHDISALPHPSPSTLGSSLEYTSLTSASSQTSTLGLSNGRRMESSQSATIQDLGNSRRTVSGTSSPSYPPTTLQRASGPSSLGSLSNPSSSRSLLRVPARSDLKLKVFMTDDPNSPNALFTLHSANNPNHSEGNVELDSFMRIRHKETKCWLHAVVGEKPEQKRRKVHHPHSSHTTNLFPPTNTDGSASPGNLSQAKVAIEVDSRSLFFDSDVYVLAPVPSHDVRTLYQVLGEIHYLQSYLGTLTRAAQHGFYQNDRRMSKWLANDTRKLSRVLSALINGCKGSTGSRLNSSAYIGSASSSSTASPAYYNSLLDLASGDSNHEQASSGPSKTPATALSSSTSLPNPKMQNLLREQNIADVLVAILARMFKGKSSSEAEDFKSQPENMTLINICKLSYSLLRHLVIDNHSNRIYLSKYVPFMLGQIGLSIKAAATLMELFKDNFDLATGITESTVQRCFLDKLIDRPVLRYVQFLGVLCECSGMPLSKNQDFIAKCILVDHSDSFLPIREHHDEESDETASSGVIKLQLRVPTKNHYKWISLDKFVEIFAPESKAVAYVVESVHLVSQVCLGGNVNSCSLLFKHISVDMLNRCLENEKLPAALRAAFCRLLLNLILADKEIAKPVSFVKYTRLWSDINKEYLKQQSTSGDLASPIASPSADPHSAPTRLQSTGPSTPTLLRKGGIRSTPKKSGFTFSTNDFDRTKQFIMTYLKDVSAHVSGPGSDRNVLIAAVVDMAKHIFSFGRFSHSDILSLIPLLLTLAHGSAFPPSYIYFDPIEKVHININPFDRSPLTRYILDFKHSIGQILDMACDYRTDCRLTQLLVLYKKKIENNNGAVPQAPSKGGNSPDLGGGVFAQIGAALRNLVDSESMLDSIEKVLEFLNLGNETYLPIVTDFLLHNQPSLATLGSRLLVRHFSQKKELLDALKAVQILVDPQLVVIYQSVSKTLNNLRRFITSSSSNEEDDGNVKNQDEAVDIMESLIALISKPKEDSDELGDSFFSSATSSQSSHPANHQKYDTQRIHEHQRLMLNLRVDVTVLELMQVEAAKLNFYLMTLCYDFLQCLCSGPFPDGQANLFRSMDLFLEHIDDEELSLQAATTIQAIFHGNRLISSQVTEIQLRKILNQVAQKKLPIYLDILTTLAQIDGKPFRRNQNLIAKLLMEKQNDVVVLYNDTASLRRRNEMIKNLQFLDPNSELVYHIKLIDLFVIACKGKVYEAEVKSQSLFSLDDILFQVSDRANWPRIKSGFIALLEEVYLVTERSLKNIAQAPQIWELMEVFIRDINAHVNHELSITTTQTMTPTKESSSVTSSPASTSSQPSTITSKVTPRRGMLQVDPNLLQQHSPQSTSDATPLASPSSAPIDQRTTSNTTGPRTLQRRAEIRQLTTTSGELKDSGLSLSGRKRALSKGNSSPHLSSVSTEELTPSSSLSISTEPKSALETSETSTQEAGISETSKTSTPAVTNERSLLRRGGANRSLRPNSSVTETSDAASSTTTDASTTTETKIISETPSTFIASTDPSIQLSAPSSQETASSTSIARPALRRPDAFNNRAGGVQSLQKKSVSWRGTPTASIDPINSEDRDLGEPSKLDELEVESSSSSSSSSDSDDSSSTSSSSSSSSSSSTDSDDEAEERRSRERLAAARARDAALNAEAEKEEEDALKAAEEAKIEEAQNSIIRKRHFFEDERSFIFEAVLPFLARYCSGQWASKRLDASQIEKLNEVLDAVHTLLEIQNLTYAEKLTVFACEEAMGTRGITGIENKLDIAKFLSDFKRLEVDPSTITPIKKEASAGPQTKNRVLTMAVVPPPLLSAVSTAAVVSSGASNPLLGPGSRQSLVRRPRSYRDLSASSNSSEAVTQGLIVFHKDCETHMKSNQELIGLASLLKRDIDDSLQTLDFNSKEGQLTSAYQSITRKLAIQLGDPEYALHNENETNMVVDILRSLRLILLEPRIEAEKTEAEERGEVLDLEESEVEKSFPGAIAMFQTLQSNNHSADDVDEDVEDDDKKLSNSKKVSQARDSSSKEGSNTGLLSKISSVLAPLSSIKAALSKDLSEEDDKSGIYDDLLTEAQNKLNVFGFAPVIAQLITSPVETVAQEAIRCAIALLWGGNKYIQDAILKVFETPASGGMFFHEMRHRLRKGMTEVEERKEFVRKQQQQIEEGQQQQLDDAKEEHEDASAAGAGSAASTPRARSDSTTSRGSSSSFDSDHSLHHRLESDNEDEGLKSHLDSGAINSTYAAKAAKDMRAMEELLRLLQLLCEGHNHVLQDYLRTQPRNIQSYDLVTETALYLEALERNIDDESVSTAIQTFTTLTEYCQGPCVDNQLALIRTKICESVNFIMHEGNVRCGKLKTLELHSACLTTLLSLLEGVSTNPLIPRHLLTSLDLTLMEHNIKEIISSVSLQLQKDGTSNKRGWRPQSKAIFDTSDLPEEVQAQIECGYLYFFLLRTLNDYDEHGKILSIIRAFPPENFFGAAVGSLEIVRSGQLERVYFRIPAVCSHLTNKSKEDLIRNVKRTNQQEKLEDMFFRSEHLLNEMEHRETLSKSPSFSWMSSNEEMFKNLSFIFSLFINFLIIGYYHAVPTSAEIPILQEDASADAGGAAAAAAAAVTGGEPSIANPALSNPSFTISPWVVLLMFILAVVQLGFSAITLFIYAVSHIPLRLRKHWNSTLAQDWLPSFHRLPESYQNLATSLFIVLSDTYFMYYLCYVVFGLLGIWNLPNAPYFFAFHLLDIVVRSELLKYVIKSVTANGKAIMLTACLALVVVYIYSIFGFLFFRAKFNSDGGCENMLMCLVTSINLGLRSGGGIGDIMEPPVWSDPDTTWRILYDSTFFFLVIVIMLNIIFGIIIDTFGELRTQNNEIEEDIKNKCFICGHERETFDRNAEGFEHHIESDHAVFHYIYFFMYLKRKERTEYTGPEQFVAERLSMKDWTFMPVLRAICLGAEHEEEDENSAKILDGVTQLTKATSTQLEQLRKGIAKKQTEMEEKMAGDSLRSEEASFDFSTRMGSYDARLQNVEAKMDRLLALLDHQMQGQQELLKASQAVLALKDSLSSSRAPTSPITASSTINPEFSESSESSDPSCNSTTAKDPSPLRSSPSLNLERSLRGGGGLGGLRTSSSLSKTNSDDTSPSSSSTGVLNMSSGALSNSSGSRSLRQPSRTLRGSSPQQDASLPQ